MLKLSDLDHKTANLLSCCQKIHCASIANIETKRLQEGKKSGK